MSSCHHAHTRTTLQVKRADISSSRAPPPQEANDEGPLTVSASGGPPFTAANGAALAASSTASSAASSIAFSIAISLARLAAVEARARLGRKNSSGAASGARRRLKAARRARGVGRGGADESSPAARTSDPARAERCSRGSRPRSCAGLVTPEKLRRARVLKAVTWTVAATSATQDSSKARRIATSMTHGSTWARTMTESGA